MANITGKAGKVVIASTTVAGIKNWSLSDSLETIDQTSFADTAPTSRSFLGGLRNASGSFSGNHTDVAPQDLDGSTVTLKLYITATKYYTVTGTLLTARTPSVDVGGEATMEYSFTGGVVTYTGA